MDVCNDNRFELIDKYKNELIEKTNIETSPDEMKVIDNILFRFWQIGWLETLEKQIPKKPIDTDWLYCECGEPLVLKTLDDGTPWKFCAKCGRAILWEDEE